MYVMVCFAVLCCAVLSLRHEPQQSEHQIVHHCVRCAHCVACIFLSFSGVISNSILCHGICGGSTMAQQGMSFFVLVSQLIAGGGVACCGHAVGMLCCKQNMLCAILT